MKMKMKMNQDQDKTRITRRSSMQVELLKVDELCSRSKRSLAVSCVRKRIKRNDRVQYVVVWGLMFLVSLLTTLSSNSCGATTTTTNSRANKREKQANMAASNSLVGESNISSMLLPNNWASRQSSGTGPRSSKRYTFNELIFDSDHGRRQRSQKQQQRGAAYGAESRAWRLEEQPPNELEFSNQTGAIVQCGVAHELARNIGKAELEQQLNSEGKQKQLPGQAQAGPIRMQDIQIRWERDNGEQVEQFVYASNAGFDSFGQQQPQTPPSDLLAPASLLATANQQKQQQQHPLRYIRPKDSALVFEPFKPIEFRPDVHAAIYRCIATSLSSGASVVSKDMQVKAIFNQVVLPTTPNGGVVGNNNAPNNNNNNIQLEVLDELVIDGQSVMFRCQIPSYAQDYLQVVDWIEYPGEHLLTQQSTTYQNAKHLFHPSSSSSIVSSTPSSLSSTTSNNQHHVHGLTRQQFNETSMFNVDRSSSSSSALHYDSSSLVSRYFIGPKTGHLHIVNVDISFNKKYFKCRAKNKLTGELYTSQNGGKLSISESQSLEAPRLIVDSQQMIGLTFNQHFSNLNNQVNHLYVEGELALLSCNVQIFSKAQISWYKKQHHYQQIISSNNVDSEPINSDYTKYVQLGNLLLINRVNRNDSGIYLCQVKNLMGEERLEMELRVRAPLKAKLSTSASVLELGKSLALECTVSGYPIHQVVFRHNQNIIKSISGTNQAGASHQHQSTVHQSSSAPSSSSSSSSLTSSSGGSYFVVDNTEADSSTTSRLQESSQSELDSSSPAQPIEGSAGSSSGNGEFADYEESEGQVEDQEKANQTKLSHVIVIVLEPQHAGAYQCFAYNQYESVQSSAYIKVLDDPPKFKDTFKSEIYEQHQDISLHCSARANPLPEITWSIDDLPIPESSRVRFGDFVTKDNLVISYVNISQTQVSDSGLYRCLADNGLAQVSHEAQISVIGALQIKPMGNLTVVASTTFRVRCPVAGYPISDIQWQHNNRRLPANHRQHIYENGTLEVEHMEKSQGDEGEYTCIASSGNQASSSASGTSDSSSSSSSSSVGSSIVNSGVASGTGPASGSTAFGALFISIKVRPTIEPFSISRSLREGQRASIMCTISSGDLPISISWFRNERPLVVERNVQETNGGEQVMVAAAESSLSLGGESITTPQVAQWSRGQMYSKSGSGMQAAGNSVGIMTNGNGNNNNSLLLPGVRISRVSDYSSTLLFESLLVQHSANYTCLARNEAGSVSHQAPMIVQVSPKWSIEPTDTNVVRGSSVSIHCMATGFPPPRIIWTKAQQQQPEMSLSNSPALTNGQVQTNGKELTANKNHHHHLGSWRSIVSSPHMQVHENGSLNIIDARDSDLGHYMCQAANGVGPGLSKVIKVIINVAAQFNSRHSIQYATKGEQAQLKCLAKGDWPLAIHWLKNKNRLEPINIRDNSSGGGALQISSNSASLLMSTTPIGVNSFVGNLFQQQQQQPLSVMEQLNSLMASSSYSSGQSSSGKLEQAGVLMQKYSLSTQEFAQSLVHREQLLVMSSSSHSSSPSSSSSSLVGDKRASSESSSGNNNNRQAIEQQQQPVVVQVSSTLTIGQVERQDSASFKCVAANHFGLDERTVQLIVQEKPDRVEELSVFEVNSRSITLAWIAPYDGNTPIGSYHIQYRALATAAPSGGSSASGTQQQRQVSQFSLASDTLNSMNWFNYTLNANSAAYNNTTNPPGQFLTGPTLGVNTNAAPSGGGRNLVKVTLGSLRPVTGYWFRLAAENKLGRSEMSRIVEASTMEEAPGAAPGKVRAVAQSSSSILVSWAKLNEKEVFGSIQGYYVAYKPLPNSDNTTENLTSQSQQQQLTNIYKTVQHDDKLNKFDALLTSLRRSTKYMISVQAVNAQGTGPASEPIVVRTLEMDPPKQVKLFVRQASNCTIELEWRPLSQAATLQLQQQQSFQSTIATEIRAGSSSQPNISPSGGKKSSQQVQPLPLALPLASTTNSDDKSKNTQQQQLEVEVVDYYSLYQAELNERLHWQEVRLPGHAYSQLIENLRCGTRYQFYMMGVNKIGVGEQSDILDTKTVGGLPLAPDRQSTFDVINTTCYVIRLDHWQDNGCPIREFNVRYKQQSALDWIQLAHLNLLNQPTANVLELAPETALPVVSYLNQREDQKESVSARGSHQTANLVNSWPSLRSRRSVSSIVRKRRSLIGDNTGDLDEDNYLFAIGDSSTGSISDLSNREEDDVFFDYSLDGIDLTNNSPAGDYQQIGDNYSSGGDQVSLSSNSTNNNYLSLEPEQSNQLFSLLKDSMMPTFETHLEQQSAAKDWPPQQDETQSAVSMAGQPTKRASSTTDHHQQRSSADSFARKTSATPTNNAGYHSMSSTGANDWRRVSLCNLNENVHYIIQVTALNSVGETEAEMRLLTSEEGLEYDQEIKRQVVSRFGSEGRMAQQSIHLISDRFNLQALNQQWPMLLPMTLLVILITIVFFVVLLLRRVAPSTGSNGGSTSTTTTTSSTASNRHCQSFLSDNNNNNNHHHHHHHLQHSTSKEPNSNMHTLASQKSNMIESYVASSFANNNNNISLYHQQPPASVFEESPYGRIGPPVPLSCGVAASEAATMGTLHNNRSSSSPATTTVGAPSSSLHSGSTGNGGLHPFNSTPMCVHNQTSPSQTEMGANSTSSNGGRLNGTGGRNVYLCATRNPDSMQNSETVFYGIEPATAISSQQQQQQQSIYSHDPVQVRQFQVGGVDLEAQGNQMPSVTRDQQVYNSNPSYIAGGVAQPAPPIGEQEYGPILSSSNELPLDSGNTDRKLDNCFMTIVEEVARANESLVSAQQQQQQQQQQRNPGCGNEGAQCNQLNCFNQQQQIFSNGAQPLTNYASVSMLNNQISDDLLKQQMNLNFQNNDLNGNTQATSNRLMFDPVYATIRRTFPQAFRYLTLQQPNHHNHHHALNHHQNQQANGLESELRLQQQQQPSNVNINQSRDDSIIMLDNSLNDNDNKQLRIND